MAENFVNIKEFEKLENDVKALQNDRKRDLELLQKIDKKVDIIFEKLTTADKTEELRLNPLEKRVNNIEDNQKWMWRTIAGTIISIIIKIIFDISKTLN